VFRFLEDKGVYDEMVEDHWGAKLVGKAVRVGCLPVVQQLFEAGQTRPQLMSELLDLSESDHGLLGAAILENHVEIVEYLLHLPGIETHIYCENTRGENMLHLASRFCNPTVVGRLVPLLKEGLCQRDGQATRF
jgi:ankyrin repeat protein